MIALLKIATVLFTGALRFVFVSLCSRRSMAAENLFLRFRMELQLHQRLRRARRFSNTRSPGTP